MHRNKKCCSLPPSVLLQLVTAEVISLSSAWKAKAVRQRARWKHCFHTHASLCHTWAVCRFVCGCCMCGFLLLPMWSWFKALQEKMLSSLVCGWNKVSQKRGSWLCVCVSMCAVRQREGMEDERRRSTRWRGGGRWRHPTSNRGFLSLWSCRLNSNYLVEIQGYVQFSKWEATLRGPECLWGWMYVHPGVLIRVCVGI